MLRIIVTIHGVDTMDAVVIIGVIILVMIITVDLINPYRVLMG